MYLAVQFNGNFGQWEKFSKEECEELRAVIPTLPEEIPQYGPHGTHILTDDAIEIVAKHSLSFELSRESTSKSIGTMLVKLQDRINELGGRLESSAELIRRGACVQIHIPDLVLLGFNEVTVLDDCCTDVVQDHLNEGWRIIAVCPPNAARRPDYILGRKV